jgi:hypothetical protein
VSTRQPEERRRPPRPRKQPKRKIALSLAGVLAAIALLIGVVLGYAARGDPPPGGLLTQTRTVPVVTVTVPEDP